MEIVITILHQNIGIGMSLLLENKKGKIYPKTVAADIVPAAPATVRLPRLDNTENVVGQQANAG